MATTPEFAVAHPDRDLSALSRLISLAFGSPIEGCKEWITATGVHHARVLREDDHAVACALRIPMAQYFGQRSVPMVGVAGVAVAPEARGRGLATQVMQGVLREMREEGAALSTLYPATLPLYRRVGFEQAGYWLEYRLPLSRIDTPHSTIPVRPMVESDLHCVKQCYQRVACGFDGYLDRGDYIWNRVTTPRAGAATGFVIHHPPGAGPHGAADAKRPIAGYVFLRQERHSPVGGRHDVVLTDICADSPAAATRLLNFLSEFGSVGDDLVFHAGPLHPLTPLLAEQKFKMQFKEYWMVRIVDVARALTSRGYLPDISARVHLDIGDELFPDNAGRYILSVSDGHATVARGGSGSVCLNIRALASLYTGFASPHSLRILGRIEGDDRSLKAAAAIFAGPAPSMSDYF